MLVFRIEGFYFVHKLTHHDQEFTLCGKMCQVIKSLSADQVIRHGLRLTGGKHGSHGEWEHHYI